MATDPIQPLPGRRPVYPVEGEDQGASRGTPARPKTPPVEPATGTDEDPDSDKNTESANHPNEE